jgi:hypothetical protein
MHHALDVPEIVKLIVDAIDPDDKRTLDMLSRTGRRFHEPALDALWSTLDDLSALAKFMPDHLWETVEEYKPREQSLCIFISIASVIFDFSIYHYEPMRSRNFASPFGTMNG